MSRHRRKNEQYSYSECITETKEKKENKYSTECISFHYMTF